MNKSQLITSIAEKSDISKSAALRALDAFVETVTEELSHDGDVTLVGFGSFKTSKRAARQGRNPQTGETIQIAASNIATFKAGANLKKSVN